MRKLIPISLIITIFLYGCSESTIDASTDNSMKSSIAKVRESLAESKRAEFDNAIKLLTFRKLDFKALLSGGAGSGEELKSKVKEAIHGKTGNQIIAEANQIKIEREQRQKEQAIQEIKELEDKKIKSTKARKELKQFKVLRSRFYKKKKKYSGEQPIIELTVKNGTSHSISRAYFKGTIASPKRSVPWHEDEFNYSISGGLEPGEKASWSLAPNMFSAWGKVDAPKDAIFTVVVTRIDGADKKPIFSIKEFGEKEEKRLTQLKEKYNFK